MSSSLKINDRKWQELKRQIPAIKGAQVTVGIQSDAGADQAGTPIAAYAAYNEFGTRGGASGGGWGGPVPARPFLGSTTDERREAWGKAADIAISGALTGTRSFEAGLSMLGELAQRDVQDKILAIATPPNSESTIELKGSSNPLIDTGAMRQSIRYVVKL
jgi:hypothetical protein